MSFVLNVCLLFHSRYAAGDGDLILLCPPAAAATTTAAATTVNDVNASQKEGKVVRFRSHNGKEKPDTAAAAAAATAPQLRLLPRGFCGQQQPLCRGKVLGGGSNNCTATTAAYSAAAASCATKEATTAT